MVSIYIFNNTYCAWFLGAWNFREEQVKKQNMTQDAYEIIKYNKTIQCVWNIHDKDYLKLHAFMLSVKSPIADIANWNISKYTFY